MKIEWNKWVNNLLPPQVRRTLMQEYASFFVFPVKSLYESFSNWKEKTKVKAAGTPQVCMLEKIIKDSLGVNVMISEGDGRPIDFIIQTSFPDIDKERQLFALLDRYKLAGKSYAYENKQVLFTATWDGFVCQKMTLDAAWNGWMCEKIIVRENLLVILRLLPSDSSVVYGINITLSPDVVLESEMTINCRMRNPITGNKYTVTSIPFKRSGSYSVTVRRAGDVSIGGNLSRYKDEWYYYGLRVE